MTEILWNLILIKILFFLSLIFRFLNYVLLDER
jgi:hypothetical protein